MPGPAFGTRFFVLLVVASLKEYLRHKPNIDSDLTSTIIDAIMVLVDNIAVLEALNPPGPK
jgi:hypothetical protein